MAKKLKLKKITLETACGKSVELSIEEARELHEQLDALFGDKYQPSYPIIINRDQYPWRRVPSPYWEYFSNANTALCGSTSQATGMTVQYSGDSING